MAEVTSGRDITVIILDQREVEELCVLLGSHPQSRWGMVAELVEALGVVGPNDLCEECGLEPGDLDCGCRCDCWHKSGRTYVRLDGLCGPTSSGHSM